MITHPVPEQIGVSVEELHAMDAYWRAANYLGAAQIYLRDNCLLKQPLQPEHIKPRLLGHWGTVPGINFIYTHLNRLIREHDASILLVTGPGHGAPANLANLYLEGTLEELYPDLTRDHAGLKRFVAGFSTPGGFPSHLYPGTPGCIHEGGELGYALATSFGAALDNPNLIVACIVGDGEAETGPTATAWHSTKFLDPVHDGAVLPILHLNGYKISCSTVFGAMSNAELTDLFHGYGYAVLLVDVEGNSPPQRMAAHQEMAAAMDRAYAAIRRIQREARHGDPEARPHWPLIILRSPNGWTGLHHLDGKLIEGSFRSHQVPAGDAKTNPSHLDALDGWLRSYRPEELFDGDGHPDPALLTTCPNGNQRMGMNSHGYGGRMRKELNLPDFRKYTIPVNHPGAVQMGDMGELGKYLRDVVRMNIGNVNEPANFRVFCPDEMTSNRLGAIFEATRRQFAWPTHPGDDFMGRSGRVIEMLSEHNCQGWLQGYLLTGRHGLFPCYEAFAPIVDSMMNQYAKFLKVSAEIPWREPVSSLNYLLTSEGWRQDHNGYSHQGPGFVNNLLTKKARHVRIYLPPDTNCLLSTVDHCLTSTDKINLVIASKQPMPQWLQMDEAIAHCRVGASIWRWASTYGGEAPDVVLCGVGVYPTAEVMAAAALLRKEMPNLRVRVVNVTDLLILEPNTFHPHGLTPDAFADLFTADRPVIINFHGYPQAVKELLFDWPDQERFTINGYIEEGTTTTPFDMLVRNGCSRYHLVIQAASAGAQNNPGFAAQAEQVILRYTQKLSQHRAYIEQYGIDPPEITDWQWVSE